MYSVWQIHLNPVEFDKFRLILAIFVEFRFSLKFSVMRASSCVILSKR
jgi:hypothetical protein